MTHWSLVSAHSCLKPLHASDWCQVKVYRMNRRCDIDVDTHHLHATYLSPRLSLSYWDGANYRCGSTRYNYNKHHTYLQLYPCVSTFGTFQLSLYEPLHSLVCVTVVFYLSMFDVLIEFLQNVMPSFMQSSRDIVGKIRAVVENMGLHSADGWQYRPSSSMPK